MSFPPYTPQYITYHKIVEFMNQVQLASPRLQSFGHGDIVYFSQTLTGGTATYPYMFVTPLNVSYSENITTYELNVIFGDIVNTDLSNEIDVVSDMSLEARNLLSQIYRGSLFNQVANVELPSNATPFLERFNDHIGGVSLNLVITVFEDMNACPLYDLPEPTATPNCETPNPTPTNTATPTTTPTNTATPTVTPTETPVLSPSPTSTSTSTPTQTPTNTSTPTPTTSPVPVPLSFTVTSGQSVYDSCNGLVSGTIYTTDLGNCAPCLPLTCFPCLLASPSQVMYLDPALTIVAPNGYYTNEMASGNFGTIFILDGVQQPGGFTGGCPGAPSPPSGSHPYTYTGYSANTTYSTACDANPASGGTPCILYGDSWPIDFNLYFYDVPSGLSTVNMFGQYYFPPQSGNTSNICFALDSDGDVQGPFSICSSIC
jgi:hypothetical protein